ncbi:MAG TPA: invasion protein expression up-regulator [Aerococcus urinaeequi]|nr:invasion protein expression up-regulator [Aerococcus urinaeequi]
MVLVGEFAQAFINQWISIKVITAKGNICVQKIKIGQTISGRLGPGFN